MRKRIINPVRKKRVRANRCFSARLSAAGGFTIVELLVAMGVFVIVIGLVIGIFVGAFRSQRSIVGLIAANDNASLALEQMMREMRTGRDFCIPCASASTGTPCFSASVACNLYGISGPLAETNSGAPIFFTNADGEYVTYTLKGVTKAIERGVVPKTGNIPVTYTPITGNNVEVQRMNFNNVHKFPGYSSAQIPWPPRVMIQLRVTAPAHPNIQTFLQTTVSARDIE